jgi:hypothetical protein
MLGSSMKLRNQTGRFFKTRMAYILLFTILIFTKVGSGNFFKPGAIDLQAVKAFPNPIYFGSESFGLFALHKLFGIQNAAEWQRLHLVICIIFSLFCLWKLSSISPGRAYLLGAIILASPLPLTIFMHIGDGTVLVLIGWTLTIFSEKRWMRLLGFSLTISAHPEHALIGMLCVYLLSTTQYKKILPREIWQNLGVAIVSLILVQAWVLDAHIPGRAYLLVQYALVGPTFFLRSFPYSLISWLGIFWPIFLYLVLRERNQFVRLKLLLTCLLIPGIFTILTADGTRVFVSLAFPCICILINSSLKEISIATISKEGIKIAIAAAILFPPLYILNGSLIMPWSTVVDNASQKINSSYTKWVDTTFFNFIRKY